MSNIGMTSENTFSGVSVHDRVSSISLRMRDMFGMAYRASKSTDVKQLQLALTALASQLDQTQQFSFHLLRDLEPIKPSE
jgi:hypothetical protein